ncbi:MAG: hypothetical protein AB7D57_09710 [Desulfovibrionaceae bacterium]
MAIYLKLIPFPDEMVRPNLGERLRRFKKKYLSLKKLTRTMALSPRFPAEWVGLPSAVAHVVINGSHLPNYYPSGPRTAIIEAHALNYDVALKRDRNAARSPELAHLDGPRRRPLAVFLESCAPLSTDVAHTNQCRTLTQEEYYPCLLDFFGRLRAQGVDVVVAAHPKAPWEGRLEHFRDMPLFQGKSDELVELADLVVMHYSTALTFPILRRKPLLFLTTDQINLGYDGQFLQATTLFLGKRAINISHDYEIDLAEAMHVEKDVYLRYEREFIRARGDDDRLFWEIVTDGLREAGLMDKA